MSDIAVRLSPTTNLKPNVWRWENDVHRPMTRSIHRVADILRITDDERAKWLRCASVRVSMPSPWSESHRAAHFAAVSTRASGRCRLSDYRLRLGLTGAELARRANVSHSDVSGLETGSESPRRSALHVHCDEWLESARRIADYLGVTCAWLWPEHAPATPRLMREETPTPESLYADAEMREVVRAAVAALPPRERAVIVRRFGLIDDEEATLEETAPHVGGVSRERVRQLEVVALRELRTMLRNTAAREP